MKLQMFYITDKFVEVASGGKTEIEVVAADYDMVKHSHAREM